jgi:hypothetical protein
VSFVERSQQDHSNPELVMSELLQTLPKLLEQGIRSSFADSPEDDPRITMQPPLEVALKLNDLQHDSLYDKSALFMVDDIAPGDKDGPLYPQGLFNASDEAEVPFLLPDLDDSSLQQEQLEERFYGSIDAASLLPWMPDFELYPNSSTQSSKT